MFPFGYGLSYTTFEYSDLHAEETPEALNLTVTKKIPVAGPEQQCRLECCLWFIPDSCISFSTKLGNAIGGSIGILALGAVGYVANSGYKNVICRGFYVFSIVRTEKD